MGKQDEIIKQARAILEYDKRINLRRSPIGINSSDGELILTGEVSDVVTKKCALQLLRRKNFGSVTQVVDRLTIRPMEHLGEGAMQEALCQALLEDSTFHDITIQARAKEEHTQQTEKIEFATWQEAGREPKGIVKISVKEGRVNLEGYIPSPSHKHLIEIMSWWLRGCRDVENHLQVMPPREETATELADALRLILEKDRLVEASQIQIDTQSRVITLKGFVATKEERAMVEADAWCLSGVEDVINQIEVRKLEV